MIDRDHDLSVVRQAKVLNLARSGGYHEPRPTQSVTDFAPHHDDFLGDMSRRVVTRPR